LIWAALPLTIASAAPGDLDPTFGTDGIAVLPSGTGVATAVAIQSDGRLVLVGSVYYSSDQVVARMNPDGTPDESFGSGGSIILPSLSNDGWQRATAVAIQSDGRILVAVNAYDRHSGYVIRLKADGSVDRSFGSKGVVDESFFIVGIVLQGARIVLGGNTLGNDFVVARLLKDGEPDSTFGTSGSTTVDVQPLDSAWDMTLDAKGRILLAGYVSIDIYHLGTTAVLRFERDGALDPGFGDGGVVLTAVSDDSYGRAVAVDPEGRIIVAGEAGSSHWFVDLIRYRANGHLDRTFGGDGIVILGARDARVGMVAPGSDGSIYVGGQLRHPWKHVDDGRMFAARYLADGTRDPSFGRDGVATAQAPKSDANDGLVQPDGKVVLAGGMGGGRGGQMLAVRFLAS
jgi:uncharacterized delta-60 repeat protein